MATTVLQGRFLPGRFDGTAPLYEARATEREELEQSRQQTHPPVCIAVLTFGE